MHYSVFILLYTFYFQFISQLTAFLEITTADSVSVTDSIERTPPRRGRPPRIRGRNPSTGR